MKSQLLAKTAFLTAVFTGAGCAMHAAPAAVPVTAAAVAVPDIPSPPPPVVLPPDDEGVTYQTHDGVVIDHCGPEFRRIIDFTSEQLCVEGKSMSCTKFDALSPQARMYVDLNRQTLDKKIELKRRAAGLAPAPAPVMTPVRPLDDDVPEPVPRMNRF